MQSNFNNLKATFTDDDINQIVALLGHRCSIKTVNRLRSLITYNASTIPTYGMLERLMKENDQWSYCDGQSYIDEIRTIRNIILKGY